MKKVKCKVLKRNKSKMSTKLVVDETILHFAPFGIGDCIAFEEERDNFNNDIKVIFIFLKQGQIVFQNKK